MEYRTYIDELTQDSFIMSVGAAFRQIVQFLRHIKTVIKLFQEIPAENPTKEQQYVLRTCVGRMIKQITPEKRVLRFLYVSINKMTWSDFYSKSKRYIL